MFLSASELFNRIAYIATSKQLKPEVQNKLMHEVLVLTCAAGLKGTKDATGNLFAKVDVLCKQKKMKQLDIFDIQKMRHDSNCSVPLSHEDLLYDLRALALFVSKVLDTDIPDFLTDKIPHSRNPKASIKHVDYRCVRCIVRSVEEDTFTAEIAQDATHKILTIDYSEPRFQYLKKILKEGVQLNLIDVTSPPALPYWEGASTKPTKGHQSASTKKIVVNGEEVTIPIKYFGSIKECNPDLYDLLRKYQLENRNKPTDAERIMWEIVRNNKLGIHFRRQHAIDDFIADFVCLSLSIIIEVDGSIHEKEENKIDDERRTRILNEKGFIVIRFTNEDIIYNTDAVIKKIQETIYKRINTATTEIKKAKVSALGVSNASANESPLPAGEGGGRGCRFIIVSPDFLLDISSLAACFTQYGHSPLAYTINRMRPMANSQAILLGNFAGSALDDIINKGDDYDWAETFKTNFREKALEYCTCTDLNQKSPFRQDAKQQVKNLREAVDVLFGKWKDKEALPGMPTKEQDQVMHYSREKAILEPSFVCEQLGLQGRIDLMTTDLQLLVEQKSGKNFSVDSQRPGEHGSMLTESHYVQLLLYYECLSRNFNLPYNSIDGRLLYSRYQMPAGLPHAAYYRKLIDAAIELRNQIVATEFYIAENGFSKLIPLLQPEALKQKAISDNFWTRWIYPQISNITNPLQTMSPIVRSYFCHMADFVYREQIASQLGVVEGTGNSTADLWNMPLSEKKETGNIYTDLHIINKEQSSEYNGYDIITLEVPAQGDDFLPNFRLGDSVYLYPYFKEQEPDVRKSLLFKGSLMEIHSNKLVVHLFDGQQNPDIFEEAGKRNIPGNHPILWCIEHSSLGGSASAALRSLHQLISDNSGKRELLLAQREPKTNKEIKLSREYHPTYDPIILKAIQAQDYFLLIGPPGTGKTSMALQFMVRGSSLLLMTYTNRAVDEICNMLSDNNIDYLRIGNEYTCDERFRDHLLDYALKDYNKLDDIKQKILNTQVIVGTTATIQNRSYIFDLKHFDVAIVDEASQILEPNIVGLLTKPDKFILIGDYKQLPAVVQQDDSLSIVEDEELHAIGLQDCRNSLFERLIRIEKMNGRDDFVGVLNRQGRMHPEIANFPNNEFYFDEHLLSVPLPHQEAEKLDYDTPSEDAIDDLLKKHRMLFFPSIDCRRPDISDKVNTSEAHIVANLLRRIHRFYNKKFDASKTVGVIVPYRNQIAMIRKEIEKLQIPELLNVSIDTVERYQGSQRDVIIYSFTIQNIYQLDFLTSNSFEEKGHIIDRKLNVAITRARKQMLITGNENVLKNNQLFKKLIESIPTAAFLHE
jgi:very-short-patch-repair endonuclease